MLAYGLCGQAIAGLTAAQIPLVIPRAHDCITLFLGSRERYREYFDNHAGVYFQTSGWIERGQNRGTQLSCAFDELVERYGEEDARYIYQELTKHYRQFTFIEMGVEPDSRFEEMRKIYVSAAESMDANAAPRRSAFAASPSKSATTCSPPQRRTSFSLARASPHTMLPRIERAMSRTASQSPLEEAGKPASMTSTRRRSSSWSAIAPHCLILGFTAEYSRSVKKLTAT